jgi:exopolyphosphatase/pppGpp-phosphohydrolase
MEGSLLGVDSLELAHGHNFDVELLLQLTNGGVNLIEQNVHNLD